VNIFFDVDYTIIAYNGTLRPRVREVFSQLKDDGWTIYVWSGLGIRWNVVNTHGLAPFVSGVYEKPVERYVEKVRGMLARAELPVRPQLVVDDYPEVCQAFGGVVVRPFWAVDERDREMERVYRLVTEYRTSGAITDASFLPPPSA
jgi:phosphoglycolate phosphatase-like HAD superfamily hydrolase